MGAERKTERIPLGLVAGYAFVFLALATLGALFYQSQQRRLRDEAVITLKSIAEMKARDIIEWRNDRLADAAVDSGNAHLTLILREWEASRSSETADEAVDKAGASRPDLILMDIRLKGLRDGIEAADEIRGRFGLPLVFVTAQSDEAILERARSTHPLAILSKPFGEHDLERLLREVGNAASNPGC